ncbi:chaoptin-like isoform X2 [Bacillus rossius redtenbacheri]|uniref:chaoptin-like isoform X2 n=1 Tax=Bacillus rossius redtenbacheri TaxID=93214 RepID=UPI002FDED249
MQLPRQVADCSGRGLYRVPDLPRDTWGLNLSGSHFSHLDDQFRAGDCGADDTLSCTLLPHAFYLELSHSRVDSISPRALLGMTELRFLYLGDNRLTSLQQHTFSDNTLLQELDVSRNAIRFLHPEVLWNLTNLLYLNLEGNALFSLHCDVFKELSSLQVLHLNSNSILQLHSGTFGELRNLETLRVDENCLIYVHEHLLRNLTNLQHFNASNNYLKHLAPTFFANSKDMKLVDLSHNFIKKLSRYVFQELVRMNFVNMSFNSLESVYLSHIPVTISDRQVNILLVPETKECTGMTADLPCFVLGFTGEGGSEEVIFHGINFAFNNITEVKFSKTRDSHSLEFAIINLDGNARLFLPVSFVQQERYIVMLTLDHTALDWRNLTLFNEIFQLPFLKQLSIVDTPACEYYTQQIMSSVFNPDMRINVVCRKCSTLGHGTGSKMTSIGNSKDEDSLAYLPEDDTTPGHNMGDHESSNVSDNDPCVYTKLVNLGQKFMRFRYSFYCESTMDCTYLSLSSLPNMKPSISCSLLSHNTIKIIEPNYFVNSYELKALDLSFNSLQHLPGTVFRALKNLILLRMNNNYLTSLNTSLFKELEDLKFLILNENMISSYSPDVFTTLLKLQGLSIDFMNLTIFHAETFKNQYSLKYLSLRDTGGCLSDEKTLHAGHFENLSLLQSVTIGGFKINFEFGKKLFLQSFAITTVDIHNSFMPILSNYSFNTITEVENITLRSNQIKDIEINVFKNLKNLMIMDLSKNEIKFLHSDLFIKTQLEYLNVSHNKLVRVSPAFFMSLKLLKVIDLSNNLLISLDYKFFSYLPMLYLLNLENNLIGTADYSYFEQDNTKMDTYVSLNYSAKRILQDLLKHEHEHEQIINISSMPRKPELGYKASFPTDGATLLNRGVFFHNLSLNELNLAHNCMNKIDNETFSSTINLIHLYLNHNLLTSINNYVFRNVIYLEKLFLHNNQLHFLEEGAFQNLVLLTYLSLSFNKLTSFDSRVLPSGNSLRHLYLNDNFIRLDDLVLDLESLLTLYLDNNPLTSSEATVFRFPSSLKTLELSNTSLQGLPRDLLANLDQLVSLGAGGNALQGLTGQHFSGTPYLHLLNVSFPRAPASTDTRLDWRNITLIDHWFTMPTLSYLILLGNPICEDIQWLQIVQNLFLSETWKAVICSHSSELPKITVTEGNVIIFSLPVSVR